MFIFIKMDEVGMGSAEKINIFNRPQLLTIDFNKTTWNINQPWFSSFMFKNPLNMT